MRYFSLFSLFYFIGFLGSFISTNAAPFMVPYRYPTQYEVTYNQNITISNQVITEGDLFIERGVLEYLVTNNYYKAKHLRQWNRLSQLSTLNPRQAIRMMRLKRKETRSLRRFQRANNIPATGIIDTPIIRIVFPVTCGTPDYVDEPIDDGFGDYEDIGNSSTVGALKKK